MATENISKYIKRVEDGNVSFADRIPRELYPKVAEYASTLPDVFCYYPNTDRIQDYKILALMTSRFRALTICGGHIHEQTVLVRIQSQNLVKLSLTSFDLDHLRKYVFPNLEALKLVSCQAERCDLSTVFPKVDRLTISDCRDRLGGIVDIGFTVKTPMTSVRCLDFDYDGKDENLEKLSIFPNLETLKVGYLSNEGVEKLAKTKVEKLVIEDADDFDDFRQTVAKLARTTVKALVVFTIVASDEQWNSFEKTFPLEYMATWLTTGGDEDETREQKIISYGTQSLYNLALSAATGNDIDSYTGFPEHFHPEIRQPKYCKHAIIREFEDFGISTD